MKYYFGDDISSLGHNIISRVDEILDGLEYHGKSVGYRETVFIAVVDNVAGMWDHIYRTEYPPSFGLVS